MKLQAIYTEREFNTWPSWHIIYEWENVLSEHLNLNFIDSRQAFIAGNFADKAIRYASRILKRFKINIELLPFIDHFVKKPNCLHLELFARQDFYFTGSKNTIPVIIDFWKNHDLESFYKAYKNSRAVLITSLEVFEYLKQIDCPLPIYHFPFSLPDKYKYQFNKSANRKFDVIMPGRSNCVLWEYLLLFEKKFPEIEYLYQKGIDNILYYFSNKTGMVGNFHDRESYMQLLQSSKVAFYTTPGIDGDEARTGGFSPVTPRFLEMVGSGCVVLARYPDNYDTNYFNLDSICTRINNYEDFEQGLIEALQNANSETANYSNYLKQHFTSQRAVLLESILQNIN